MFRLTIIPSDGAVYFQVLETDELKIVSDLDLSFIDPTVHALQWHVDAGWIEYIGPLNVNISEIPEWAIEAMDLALSQNN